MLNLYFFNSPENSSVGFRRAAWSLKDGKFAEAKPEELNRQAWEALLGGGANALCFDTRQCTRAFMIRDLSVFRPDRRSWRMNLLLETDEESYGVWGNLTAMFLLQYRETSERLADLFSVGYDGGERYFLDTDGMLAMTEEALQGKMAEKLSGYPHLARVAAMLNETFTPRPDRVFLLVPSATADYFYEHTSASLAGISRPDLIIENERWQAILNREPLSDEDETDGDKGSRKPAAQDISDETEKTLAAAAIVIGAAVLAWSALRAIRRSKTKKGLKKK